jgi:hypothetical protein
MDFKKELNSFLDDVTQMDDNIKRFLQARPNYSLSEVEYIAKEMTKNNVPFCLECRDWHKPKQPHSM